MAPETGPHSRVCQSCESARPARRRHRLDESTKLLRRFEPSDRQSRFDLSELLKELAQPGIATFELCPFFVDETAFAERPRPFVLLQRLRTVSPTEKTDVEIRCFHLLQVRLLDGLWTRACVLLERPGVNMRLVELRLDDPNSRSSGLPGLNAVRLYRPQQEIPDGKWKLPGAEPVS